MPFFMRETISIHAPAWGATESKQFASMSYAISIHAPAWGATTYPSNKIPLYEFQSTRPRGARQVQACQPEGRHPISIHAPAWGATLFVQQGNSAQRISIHAPAWGATFLRHVFVDVTTFQSTRPRGARPPSLRPAHYTFYFNPRARVGRDSAKVLPPPALPPFQSTRPRGARRRWRHSPRQRHISIHAPAWGATSPSCGCRICQPYFNPRARVGRDSRAFTDADAAFISIHAPAWGATGDNYTTAIYADISIHAPAWGATTSHYNDKRNNIISIHAPAWGAT